MTYSKIYFIHGLFGESFLPKHDHLQILSPYTFSQEDLLSLEKDSLVIGYSLGGRVLLRELEKKGEVSFKKVVLISTHYGLEEEERNERRKLEDHILSHMTQDKIQLFWDSLSIFKGDGSVQIDVERIDFYREQFQQNRLSNQKNYLEFLLQNKDKFEIHLGEFDLKYRSLYQSISDLNQVIHPGCGHRGPIYQLENIL